MIKNLCNNTYNKFTYKDEEDKNKSLLHMHNISKYTQNNFLFLSDLEHIINLEKKLLSTNGKYKIMIERKIFNILKDLTDCCM